VAEAARATIAGAAAIIDRGGNRDRLSVPLHSLVRLEVAAYPAESCPLCTTGMPVVKPGSRSSPR